MSKLVWDQIGERLYETGTDHGVLFVQNADGTYANGVAWNGLTAVTESPSGAEDNPQYADNIKYLNLRSVEEFGGTIEAFTYPDEFGVCDGTIAPTSGLNLGQQSRRSFGLAYRTLVGNDTESNDHGYKIHLVYGASVSPSERSYATVNDSPEPITLSWEFKTTPVSISTTVGGKTLKPVSCITIDSTKVDADKLAAFEETLYGTDGTSGTSSTLPTPDAVIAAFATVSNGNVATT